jgi:hypothetical protein
MFLRKTSQICGAEHCRYGGATLICPSVVPIRQGCPAGLARPAAGLGVKDPRDPLQNATGAARLDAELLKRYGGDMTEALAAYNWNPSGVDAALALSKKTGKDCLSYAPKETQEYISKLGARSNGVDINIYDNTGGSAVVTVSGLAH